MLTIRDIIPKIKCGYCKNFQSIKINRNKGSYQKEKRKKKKEKRKKKEIKARLVAFLSILVENVQVNTEG